MVNSMATTKITIALPDSQLEEIRRRVAAKESDSVSGLIQQAVRKSLDNAAEFREMVDQALLETGGMLTAKERAWARKMLAPRKRSGKAPKARKAATRPGMIAGTRKMYPLQITSMTIIWPS